MRPSSPPATVLLLLLPLLLLRPVLPYFLGSVPYLSPVQLSITRLIAKASFETITT
jgi:hypothetical protein